METAQEKLRKNSTELEKEEEKAYLRAYYLRDSDESSDSDDDVNFFSMRQPSGSSGPGAAGAAASGRDGTSAVADAQMVGGRDVGRNTGHVFRIHLASN